MSPALVSQLPAAQTDRATSNTICWDGQRWAGPAAAIDPLLLLAPHLPAPPNDVFLEQHLGLEPAVAALGLFCQVVEPGMLQALAGTHSGTGDKKSLGHPCLSPCPPATLLSSPPKAPKPAGGDPGGTQGSAGDRQWPGQGPIWHRTWGDVAGAGGSMWYPEHTAPGKPTPGPPHRCRPRTSSP